MSDAILTASDPEWTEITESCRPHGKCLLLTCEGVAVIGEYDGHPEHYVAFFALPKVPKGIKERLRNSCSTQAGKCVNTGNRWLGLSFP